MIRHTSVARICLLTSALWFLAGCGFHTLYGSHTTSDGTPVTQELNQVAIDNVPNHEGQILRNDLIDKMYGKGRPARPAYTLVIKLHHGEEDIGVMVDATTAFTLMNMYADYDLKDMQGKVLVHGTAHSTTTFNKLNDQYATLAARETAFKNTIDEVSEQIVNRVSLYFSEKP